MGDKRLKALLEKYLNGSATPEEKQLVNDWYDALHEQKTPFLDEQARRSLRAFYWKELKARMHGKHQTRRMWPAFFAVAASLTLIAVTIFYFMPPREDSRVSGVESTSQEVVVGNTTSQIRMVTLPDLSTVTLFPKSTLRYGKDFNINQRRIDLAGQAFFEVTHDAERPFFVYANDVVAKVLGTSFSVTAYPADDSVTIMVKTGRVLVRAKTKREDGQLEDRELILAPNQQAVYSRNNYEAAFMELDQPNIVIRHEQAVKVRFEGAPVSEVFKTLADMYKVQIEFDEAAFSTCSITTSSSGKDMYERIDVICEIIGATYTIKDNKIMISGSGCN